MLPTKQTGFAALSQPQQQEHRAKIGVDDLREVLSVDPVTGKLFWVGGPLIGREAFTAISKDGYRVGLIRRRQYPAHHVVFALSKGQWPQDQIDHINGDRLDNRPDNLREATHKQNMRNKGSRPGSSSKYKGVYRRGNSWCAQIKRNGRRQYLGAFSAEIEAANAYNAAAEKFSDPFLRVNELEGSQ